MEMKPETEVRKLNRQPNIILILADDMGFSDLGCYGGEILTPHIDQLSDNGIRFSQFYNTARCCPTRASLLTGLHPHQTGIGHMTNPPGTKSYDKGVYGYRGYLNRDCVTLAEVLKEHGYHTYMSGKWHLGDDTKDKWPLQRGFERFYGILAGACNYFNPSPPRGLMKDNEQVEPHGDNYYTTDAFTDEAISFLQEKRDDKPFFLYLAYNAPHWPLQAKQEDTDKFIGKYLSGWDKVRQSRHAKLIEQGIISDQCLLSPRDPSVRPWGELDEDQKIEMDYRMAVYAAQIHSMDRNVGKLVQLLKEKDEFNNTVIMFLSDNGGCAEGGELGGGKLSEVNHHHPNQLMVSYGKAWANVSNTPFRKYKHYVHEGGIATPFIVHGPVIPKPRQGMVNHSPGYLIDIMPTILELAGAGYPVDYNGHNIHPLGGKSLVSLFHSDCRDGHEYLFLEHENNCTIRNGKWKAIQKYDSGEWELYDLNVDRTELNDLAGDHPEIIAQLSIKWLEWAEEHHVVPKGE
jgi:arylsulfatase A-like enzyme